MSTPISSDPQATGYQPCQKCQNRQEKPNDTCNTQTGSRFCDGCCPKTCPYFAQCYIKSRQKNKIQPNPDDTQRHHFLDLLKKEAWGAQAVTQEEQILNPNEPVKFTQIAHQFGHNVHYDSSTGTFTIFEPATLSINWWVVIEGTYQIPTPSLALTLNDHALGAATLPQPVGQLTGHSLITTSRPNATLTLQNATDDQLLTTGASLMVHSV